MQSLFRRLDPLDLFCGKDDCYEVVSFCSVYVVRWSGLVVMLVEVLWGGFGGSFSLDELSEGWRT